MRVWTCSLYLAMPGYAAGYGLTFVLMQNRIRFGLHKFAKEGLVCLLESCTAKEAEQVNTNTQLKGCIAWCCVLKYQVPAVDLGGRSISMRWIGCDDDVLHAAPLAGLPPGLPFGMHMLPCIYQLQGATAAKGNCCGWSRRSLLLSWRCQKSRR